MSQKGRIKYVPRDLLDELEKVKIKKKVTKDSVAFRNLVEYSRVGRKVEDTVLPAFTIRPPRFKKLKWQRRI